MVIGDVRRALCTKIRYINKDIVIAAAGDVNNEAKALRYFSKKTWRDEDPPEVKKGGFQCIIIINDTPFFCDGALLPQLIEHPYYAIGSGSPYAAAAMEMGMSAVEAVKFASKLDVNTNDIVQTYTIKDYNCAKKTPATKKPKATQ
jgi:20S proteasome alpha/beta subunit